MDFNGTSIQLVMLNVSGIPEFDYFFTLVFCVGLASFLISAPIRLFMNRFM